MTFAVTLCRTGTTHLLAYDSRQDVHLEWDKLDTRCGLELTSAQVRPPSRQEGDRPCKVCARLFREEIQNRRRNR